MEIYYQTNLSIWCKIWLLISIDSKYNFQFILVNSIPIKLFQLIDRI